MKVVKRDGRVEDVNLDKILKRIANMAKNLPNVESMTIAQRVIAGLYDGVTTVELDDLAVKTAAGFSTRHPDYELLAARLSISMLHKDTSGSFAETMERLYERRDATGRHVPAVSEDFITVVRKHSHAIDSEIVYKRDYWFDYLGVQTLRRSYLNRIDGKIVERPQHMWMRVAIGIHGDDLPAAFDTYDRMSRKLMTHATPTLFNAGTTSGQLSSCYLLEIDDDSIRGIYKTLSDCAAISKMAGGIGVHVHKIRSAGARIYGTGGVSNGLVPMLRNFDSTASYVDQCFHPETLIGVVGSSPVPIQKILVGERVFTGGGAEEVAEKVEFDWDGEILRIENERGAVVRVTEDHDFRVLRDGVRQWVKAKDLCIGENMGVYAPIKSVSRELYCGPVYDLRMRNQIRDPDNASYVTPIGIAHNGGGKRKGSFAMYLEPWHPDVFEFLDLKRNQGKDEMRARNLFYALWVPDLFMERVKDDAEWTLMDPAECPGLYDAHSEDFERLYLEYEESGRGRKTIRARELWKKIYEIQNETSMPYIMFKDTANRCSNQRHLGTIKSSNLCAEIVEYTSPGESAVCNLASVALPAFVEGGDKRVWFNHKKLWQTVQRAVRNLDRVIDVNLYPTYETNSSNMNHRPIGLGVQGLADVFLRLRLNWDDPEAFQLNREIFETIYHAALTTTVELASDRGRYPSFEGSPASQGLLQFDLQWIELCRRWETVGRTHFNWADPREAESGQEYFCSKRYDWDELRIRVMSRGMRNSLLVALMPTASTASILGNTESFEPVPANIYKRNVLSGEFVRVNRSLVDDLQGLGLWNDRLKDRIIAREGSIQGIEEIPEEIRRLYRTVFELPQKPLIEMSAMRQAFVCQSQSFNLYFADPSYGKLTSALFHGHSLGLKTGSYYIRQTAARQAQKVTVDPNLERESVDDVVNDEAAFQRGLQVLQDRGFTMASIEEMARDDIVEFGNLIDNDQGCLNCSA